MLYNEPQQKLANLRRKTCFIPKTFVFYMTSTPFFQGGLHHPAGVLHNNGVLSLRSPLQPHQKRTQNPATRCRQLGQANCAGHELPAQPQDHSQGPQEPQVSLINLVIRISLFMMQGSSCNFKAINYFN